MLLSTTNLKITYGGQKPLIFQDFHVDKGDALLILGKSGSGKTTLLNLISGLLKPSEGTVLLDGVDLDSLSSQELDKLRGAEIGIVFQKPHLIAALSVKENLQLAKSFSGKKGQDINALLSGLGIESKANSAISTLSEGEAQRVSIARALINSPKLILADEPTSSLDDEHAAKVIQLLQDQAATIGAGLIIVTHDQRVKSHISNFIEVKSA
jgi:putative ABC transport system ATP-binding protein